MTQSLLKFATGLTSAGIELNASSSNLGIKITVYVYFLLLLLKLLIVGYQAFKCFSKEPKYTSFLSILLELHTEILFYPINFILTELIVQIYYDENDMYLVPNLQIAGFCVLLTLSLGIALFKAFYCYSPVPLYKITNRKGSFHLIGILIIKMSLTLFSGFAKRANSENIINYQIASGVISLVFSGLILVYTRLTLPEYNLSMIKIHTIYDACMMSISIIQLISLSKIHQGSIVGLLVFVPLLGIKLYLNSLESLINSLTFQFQKNHNAKYLAHIEVLYTKIGENLNLNVGKTTFSRDNLMAQWIIQESGKTQNYEDFMENCKDLMIKLFEDFLTVNPKNNLILLCYIRILIQSKKGLNLKAYSLCKKSLLKKNISIQDRIALYAMLCQIQLFGKEENNSSQSVVLWDAFRAEQMYESIKKDIADYIQHKSLFWRFLKDPKPDMLSITEKARYLDHKNEMIKRAWMKYESAFVSGFPLAYLVYGIFKQQFGNSPIEGENYLSKYFQFKQNKKIEDEKLFNQNDGTTVMISGEKESLGQILSCSESIQKMFGFHHRAILGQNISIIMPRFFKERHDRFILDFENTGKSRIMGNEETLLFGKNQQNDIFPVTINLSIQQNLEQGIMYTALLRKINDESEYLLCSENGEIEEMSCEFKRKLHLNHTKKIKINEICREYNIQKSDLLENETMAIRIYKKVENKKRILNFKSLANGNNFLYETEMFQYTYSGSVLNIMKLKLVSSSESSGQAVTTESEIVEGESPLRNPTQWKVTEFETMIAPDHTEREEFLKRDSTRKTSEITQTPPTRDIPQKVKIHLESSLSKKTSNTGRKRIIHEMEKIYAFPPVNKKKIGLVSLFSLILTGVGIVMATIAYFVFRISVQDISFTIQVIRANFDRLNAVSVVFKDTSFYQAGIDGTLDYNAQDYNSILESLAGHIDTLKKANNALAEIIQRGDSDQQSLFYAKSVRIWKDAEMTDLDYYFNTFEAITLFVEKLILFYEKCVVLSSYVQDENLQYVRQNLFNDLLISSESMVSGFQDMLSEQLTNRQGLLQQILILSIVVILVAGMIILLTLYIDMQANNQIFSALVTINPSEVTEMEVKLEYFSGALLEKQEEIISRKLYSLYQKSKEQSNRAKFRAADLDNFSSQRVLSRKIKESLIIGAFLGCYAILFFVRFRTSSVSLSDIISFNNRIDVLYENEYETVISASVYADYLDYDNTIYFMNSLDDDVRRKLLRRLEKSGNLVNAFTDSNGVYIDANVEAVFEDAICPYLVNYPEIDCELGTGGQPVGLIELNLKFFSELEFYDQTMTNNFTFELGRELLPLYRSVSLPKLDVILGAYTYIAEEMNKKSGNKIDNLLGKEPIYFALELIGFYILSFIAIRLFIQKFINNRMICVIVRVIPYQEVLKNNLLRHTIIRIFNKRAEFLKKETLFNDL